MRNFSINWKIYHNLGTPNNVNRNVLFVPSYDDLSTWTHIFKQRQDGETVFDLRRAFPPIGSRNAFIGSMPVWEESFPSSTPEQRLLTKKAKSPSSPEDSKTPGQSSYIHAPGMSIISYDLTIRKTYLVWSKNCKRCKTDYGLSKVTYTHLFFTSCHPKFHVPTLCVFIFYFCAFLYVQQSLTVNLVCILRYIRWYVPRQIKHRTSLWHITNFSICFTPPPSHHLPVFLWLGPVAENRAFDFGRSESNRDREPRPWLAQRTRDRLSIEKIVLGWCQIGQNSKIRFWWQSCRDHHRYV